MGDSAVSKVTQQPMGAETSCLEIDQIYDESSLITQHYRDFVKLRQKTKSITLSGLIFQLDNIFFYHLLVIIIPLSMHIWGPGNIWVSHVLHGRQNLVSR